MLAEKGLKGGVFCDLFSGSTVVSQMAKGLGFSLISNDLQTYSAVFGRAFVASEGYPDFSRLREEVPEIEKTFLRIEGKELWIGDERQRIQTFGLGTFSDESLLEGKELLLVLIFLDRLAPREGRFFQAYCEGGTAGRSYFSRENGQRCEAIRATIEDWKNRGWLAISEHALLLASLIESMDLLANTASVYGAYLKKLKTSARQALRLRFPLLPRGKGGRVLQGDSNQIIRQLAQEGRFDVLYLDPPYNRRQYHSNYHILETLACWDLDKFEPAGKTGLRPVESRRSDYCLKRGAAKAFADLIEAANFRHLLVSYNNEGIVPEEEIKEILLRKGGKADFRKIPYRRFRADQDSAERNYRGDQVEEFLFYIDRNK